MSNPSPPVFDISGGTSGTSNINIVFTNPSAGLEILWSYDGSDPTNGAVWAPGQVIPYNSWIYQDADSVAAVVYVQAIMHDTVQDTYSSPVVQDYVFTCADPIINQTSTVNVSCSSPNSLLYYYSGTLASFNIDTSLLTPTANPSSLSLANGQYVFIATTSDGIVYNQNIVETTVSSGTIISNPILTANGIGNIVYISATCSTVGVTFRYTTNGTTPNVSSTIMPTLLPVSTGLTVSIIAELNGSISNPTSTVVKPAVEYILKGLFPSNKSIRLSSTIPLTKIDIKSFSIFC